MTPLIPEDGPHFEGNRMVNYSPLLRSLSQCSACHGVLCGQSLRTHSPENWASWVKSRPMG